MTEIFRELKRRKVFKVAIAYLAASWLIVQLVETLFPVFGLSNALIRLVVILLAIVFPFVLILSWVFRFTPEGLLVDRGDDDFRPPSKPASKKLDHTMIVVLALALCYFVFDKFVFDPVRDAVREEEVAEQVRREALTESYGEQSIAVLPFVNMSEDPGNEYFSDGISEELLNLLSRIPGLRVISRSSSFSFKGKPLNARAIAERLDVANILEGSVRKSGNRVRITAQLIDARSDAHLWSQTYDRELADIFEIQDEISSAIVESLRGYIAPEEKVPGSTTVAASQDAYEAYLRGRHLVAQRTQSGVEGAIEEFRKAVELEPGFALGHAELASAIMLGYTGTSRSEVEAQAAPHVMMAEEIDPTLAETRAAAGRLAWVRGDLEGAIGHFEEAVQINPNYAVVYAWLGLIKEHMLGRYEESFAARQKSVQLDPISIPAISNYAYGLIYRNRLDEADRQIEKLAAIAPSSYARLRGFRKSLGGNWSSMLLGNLEALRLNPKDGGIRNDLAAVLAALGLVNEALAIREPTHPNTFSILGQVNEAVLAAEIIVADNPALDDVRYLLGLVLAGAGDYVRARPILEELWLRQGDLAGVQYGVEFAAALIASRRSAGDDVHIDQVLTPMREDIARRREADITTDNWYLSTNHDAGVVAYLAGERAKGLELIAKAVQNGYYVFPNEAYYQELYDEPGFVPIRASQERHQAREREKFLSLVCHENPYASVWQPAESTCEDFSMHASAVL